MRLTIQHIEIHVSSIEKAKAFYRDMPNLEVLEENSVLNLVVLKAGSVRNFLNKIIQPSKS